MTKADIINEIVERTGVGKKDVAAVVEEFMSCIKESMMERKENVYLRGFGSFVVKQRAEKTARNISKNIFSNSATCFNSTLRNNPCVPQ